MSFFNLFCKTMPANTMPANTIPNHQPTTSSFFEIHFKNEDMDEYYHDAAILVLSNSKVSIGMLQRYLKIGFNRAALIMDQLEATGVVGPEAGTQQRKVLISKDNFISAWDKYSSSKPRLSTPEEITFLDYDAMSGIEFESFCTKILTANGFYNVKNTQSTSDHGIDILAEKDDITYAIQCKCYSSNIGNAAIQQAFTGKKLYRRDIAVVLTNQYFTQQAQEEAAELGVKLWDRDKLNELITCANS